MEEQLKIKGGLEDILKKSSDLMSRKGYHATSMRDLARATGLSLAGLYHHFHNKEELLYLINFLGFSTLKKKAATGLNPQDPVEERLKSFIRTHIRYFFAHRSDMKVMTFGAQDMDRYKLDQVKNLKEEYRQICRALVAELIKSRTGRAPRGKELDRKTFLLFGMMNWTFGWYSEKKYGPDEDLIDDIFTTFMHGVSMQGEKNGTRGRC